MKDDFTNDDRLEVDALKKRVADLEARLERLEQRQQPVNARSPYTTTTYRKLGAHS